MTLKIRIDVLTLDSVQCAACSYMMESIAAMPEEIQQIIDYKEWSIKTRDGLEKFTALKVRVVPTICIEGEPVFQSTIPLYEELIDAMIARSSSNELVDKLTTARDKGFEFDKLQENLDRAGSGHHTREQ